MISLYRPGDSAIHRLPAWLKLALLALILTGLALLPKVPWVVGLAICCAYVAFLVAGFGTSGFLQIAWRFKALAIVIAIPQLFLVGIESGIYNTLIIVGGLLLATLVTMTTKTSEIVDLIKKITRSENFALLIGLSINSLAVVGHIASGIVQAGKARGVKPNTVRQLTNLFVVSLKQADDYAEALAARGVQV